MDPVSELGFFGRIGNRMTKAVVGWATSHAPSDFQGRSIQIKDSSCGKLIKDISSAMSGAILKNSDNTFVVSGSEEIKQAMDDLTNHVFIAFATGDIGEAELSDDELTDHFFGTIIKKIASEFEAHPTLDTHAHFKNIAHELLHAAFPNGPDDEKLPLLLRKLLNGNLLVNWIAKRKIGTDQDLSWKGLTTLFANHLESIYSCLIPKPSINKPDADISQFIDAIIKKIDTASKETSAITVALPQLNQESNAFISKFLQRLLQGNFSRQEDKELLDKARDWLLTTMKTSLETIYSSIFTCKPGQTAQERRIEFAGHISTKAKEILPQVQTALQEIESLTQEEIVERESTSKEALKTQVAISGLKRILESELQPKKIASLLPPFLPAETTIDQIYAFLAPYLIEVVTQFGEIERQGVQAVSDLQASDITKWVDKGLESAQNLLQAKAQDNSFAPTEFAFINDLLRHGMAGSSYLRTNIKHIIAIIIKHAVGQEGLKNPEKAIADIINMILTEGQKAIEEKRDLTEASRTILGKVISKELFNSLLPPFLRKIDFYEDIVKLLQNYIKGLSEQTEKIQGLKVRLLVPELKNMLDSINKKLLELMQKQTEGFAGHLVQGKGLITLVENALPKIVEAVIAYHVNPKANLRSEKRTAELFLHCISIAEQGFERANSDPEQLDAILRETAETLVRTLLPEPLLNQLIPKEFAPFHIDKLLAQFIYDYIKSGYEYSHTIKQLASEENRTQANMLIELQKYIQTELQANLLTANKKKTWIEEVAHHIFATENSSQKELLMKFTTNLYLGAIGALFKTTSNIPGGSLLPTFEPIAQQAQELFLALNANGDLGISKETIDAYKKATGKDGTDIKHLAYWQAARKALDHLYSDEEWNKRLPNFLHDILTKDMASNFAITIYETVHSTQMVLQQEEAKGERLVSHEKDLGKFIDSRITDNIVELLRDLAKENKPLNSTLPTLLDNFIKECCKDDSRKVADIRNTLIKRLVYTVMGKLLSLKTPLVGRLKELVKSYQEDEPVETSNKLIELALPREALETPLAKLLVSKIVQRELADSISQIKTSVNALLADGKRAKEYLYNLEGMKTFTQEVISNLDESLNKHAGDKDHKLSEELPDYVDKLIKDCILDPTLGPLVKKGLHNIVYIILEEALTPKLGESIPHRFGEVIAQLMEGKGAVEWLKTVMPEARLKALLPDFLKNSVTHQKLVKWFFAPYEQQIAATKEKIAPECQKPVDPRVVPFVKKSLLGFTEPTATQRGLFGYKGVARELERTLLVTQIDHVALEATIGQITRNLEAGGFLDPRFLSEALFHGDEAPRDANLPQAILAAILPQGKASLLVPDVAKEAVWEKVCEAIDKFVADLLDPKERLLLAIDRMIPFTTDDKVLIGKRQQQIEDMRHNGIYNPKVAESCFKKYLQEAFMRNVELAVEKEDLWGPIKWLKKTILKAATYLTMRFSLRDRFYNFVISPKSNDTIKNMIWSFITYKLPAQPKGDLKQRTKKLLEQQALAPFGLRDIIATQFASYLQNKTLLDIVCA